MTFATTVGFSKSFSSASVSGASVPTWVLGDDPLPSVANLPLGTPVSPDPDATMPLRVATAELPLTMCLCTSYKFFSVSERNSTAPKRCTDSGSIYMLWNLMKAASVLPNLPYR